MKQIIQKLKEKLSKLVHKKNKGSKKEQKKARFFNLAVIGGIAVVILGVLVYLLVRNPGFLLVAKVNNAYITRFELNRILVKSFGAQALEDLAYKKLAEAEFKKNNIVVSPIELDARIAEIEQSLGGMSLDAALSSSGMTVDDLRENITLQMSLEKLLSDKTSVTEDQINTFISQNEEQLKDLTDEEKNSYAQEQIKQQNLQVEISKWFTELKEKADIKFYL